MGMTDFTGIAQSRSACVKPLSAKRFPALGTILRLLLSHTEIDAGPPQKPPQSSHCFRAIRLERPVRHRAGRYTAVAICKRGDSC